MKSSVISSRKQINNIKIPLIQVLSTFFKRSWLRRRRSPPQRRNTPKERIFTMIKKFKRVFLIILDSLGAGECPDSAAFGDEGASTLGSLYKSGKLNIPNLISMGLGNIEGISYLGKAETPSAAYGRMSERSNGKDTTIGHWEIAGLISDSPLPTYPNGFPDEVIDAFEAQTGRKVLCNKPYSGTDVIRDYGEEHLRTGDLIVYTSADSVFQIAAHEDIVTTEKLYEYCRMARNILSGEHSVGRVIARPFIGEAGSFKRTANRRDFSLAPWGKTMLDALAESGKDVLAVGKISDIFAGSGISEKFITHGNCEGMEKALELAEWDFDGLCFINLVDFDSVYGHRNDATGYAEALNVFDAFLPEFLQKLREDDMLIITADHGCDPGDISTDHTREYVPLLVYGKGIEPRELGTRGQFSDVARTVSDAFSVKYSCEGENFFVISDNELMKYAEKARENAYCPYSGFSVGAALLTDSGEVYLGCNIENASFSPTVCAERTAIFSAIAKGTHDFVKIAVCGGKEGEKPDKICTPCGVCRQVMSEFCPGNLPVVLGNVESGTERHSLSSLLPMGFDLK